MLQHYPEAAAQPLRDLVNRLAPVRAQIHSLVVYGSLPRGEFIENETDIDLAIVLENASASALGAIRQPLEEASETMRLQPLVLGRAELPRLADVFPVLMSEIKRHHDLILGDDDPFSTLAIERTDLRRQVEHELRNHLLRLRRYYLIAGDDAAQLSRAIVASSRALVHELDALLEVVGASPDQSSLQAVFVAAAETFGLDYRALKRIGECEPSLDPASHDAQEIQALFFELLSLVERAVDVVDQLDIKVWGEVTPRH